MNKLSNLRAEKPEASDWELATVEASALLQIDHDIIATDSGEWDADRKAWIAKWAPSILGEPDPNPEGRTCETCWRGPAYCGEVSCGFPVGSHGYPLWHPKPAASDGKGEA